MSRTTLDLDNNVLEQLRKRAAIEHKSMGQVASEVMAPALAEGGPARKPRALRWVAKSMGTPLIDIDDKDAVGRMFDREYLEKLQ
jgi:plasmid stability protein